jgi:DNA repair protein RecN (Recombination protein N)
MLRHLTILNVTLVRDLDLEFEPGMTVVTGETGAGKSIMLDALSLALGSRADSNMLAVDADRAEINATFELGHNQQARQWLRARELGEEEDCILRRVINRDGRSRAFINGVPSTLADVSELGSLLADIHSQHEHQSLLKPDTHRRLLDEFGSLTGLADEVASLYGRHREAATDLARLTGNAQEGTARLQLLSYQADELEALAVTAQGTSDLEAEQKRLTNAEDITTSLLAVIDSCSENEEVNVSDLLRQSVDRLAAIGDDALGPVIELLASSRIQVDEAIDDLQRLSSHYEADPARLREVESRLDSIYDIARKHRVRPEELPSQLNRISEEIEALAGIEDRVELLTAELTRHEQDYQKAAARLSSARRDSGTRLAAAVTARLGALGMSEARLTVEMSPRDGAAPHPHGGESVEFRVTTNPRQPARALARVASGGELSRLSLAIQVVAADTSEVPTLVFDEVDVGIGGGIAEVVGAQLRELGRKAQIICVTHLPQVAAQGHHHLHVSKSTSADEANTQVRRLTDDDSRIEEISRMLGGLRPTKQSVAHARQMFVTGQDPKPA